MKTHTIRVELSLGVKRALQQIAETEKRSLKKHCEFILEREVRQQYTKSGGYNVPEQADNS